eukprot:935074-Rhodomonas_salina.1
MCGTEIAHGTSRLRYQATPTTSLLLALRRLLLLPLFPQARSLPLLVFPCPSLFLCRSAAFKLGSFLNLVVGFPVGFALYFLSIEIASVFCKWSHRPDWWVEIKDPSGRPYYENHITKTTQWERPVY